MRIFLTKFLASEAVRVIALQVVDYTLDRIAEGIAKYLIAIRDERQINKNIIEGKN